MNTQSRPTPPLTLKLRDGASEIYLIRHADVLQGSSHLLPGGAYEEQPLSEHGRVQAQALAQGLRGIPFVAIYSSRSRRSFETAEPLAQVLGKEIQIEPNLHDMAVKSLTSQFSTRPTPDEHEQALNERFASVMQAVANGGWSAVETEETREQYRQRTVAALDALAQQYAGQRIAVISHGGVISAYLGTTLGIERDFFFPIVNTSVNIVRVLAPKRGVITLNDLSHLREIGVPELSE